MTFTEAALEVLRSAGEPLHYKRITELAIEKNLLSHVGKTPEVTMSSRLAMMVKKDRGTAPIMKVKPGVFAIREEALKDFAAAVAAAAAMEAESSAPSTDAEASAGGEAAAAAAPAVSQKPPALPGADMFPEEEGDDDPILAGLEQESADGDKSGRRRRRRRRRGKGGGDLPLEGAPRNGEPLRGDQPHAARSERGEREGQRDFQRDSRDNRDRSREREREREPRRDGRDGRDSRDARDNRDTRELRDETPALDWNRQPGDGDLLGRDLADAVWIVLSRGERVPHGFPRIADLLVRRGRLTGNSAALAPTVAAAVRADIARAERVYASPRFRMRNGRVLLTEWQQPKVLARAAEDMLRAADRYSAELRRTLIHKLSEMPAAGFAELIATWLNVEGVTALRAVRRPESSSSEFHFAGTLKRGSEETRLAIVVLRGNREATREHVVDVRGGLHHYGQATSAWLVTTGRITSGAREEAAMPGAAACSLFDGMALATAMERLGVAVRKYVVAHHEIDFELFEALGDTQDQRDRREREERDREARWASQQNNEARGEGRGRSEESQPSITPAAAAAAVASGSEGEDADEHSEDVDLSEVNDSEAAGAEEGDWDEEAGSGGDEASEGEDAEEGADEEGGESADDEDDEEHEDGSLDEDDED